MNKTFKVIWNHSTQTWTAVSELAGTRRKSKSIKLTAISAALLMACGTAQAATHTAADDLVAISNNAAASTAVPDTEKAQATGSNAIAAGRKAKAETANSVAIGPSAEVLEQPRVPFNSNGIAIGAQARIEPKVNGNAETDSFHNSIAIGTRTLATASHAIVIGRDASSMRNQNAATYQTGENIVAIGNKARADWEKSIAIGANSSTVSPEAIAVGANSMASGGGDKGGVAIGSIAHANHVGTVAVGSGSNASNVNSMAMGFKASSVGRHAVTVGTQAFSHGDNAVTIGDGAMSGWNSANRAVTVGANARTVTDDGLSVGYNAFAGNFRSTAIGKNAVSYGAQALALGSEDLGGNASAANIYKKNTMAIGKNSSAVGTNSIATGDNNIAFGTGATAGVAQASVNDIRTAYADYRKAYETYANLDKKAENAKANAGALKTIVADLSTNLKIFHYNYTDNGVLYKHSAEFKKALEAADLSLDKLGTLTNEFSTQPDASDANIAKVLAKKADIEKIANITETEVGGKNERLAHLVALAKNLNNKITELEAANTASATATKAKNDGKAAHDAAQKAFETSYAGKNATNAIAIGASSETASNSSTAVGHKAKVNGVSPNAVAIGTNTRAGESDKVTRDGAARNFTTNAPNATAVGSDSLVALENSTAVGYNNMVRAKNAGAFGAKNRVGQMNYEVSGPNSASATPNGGEGSFVVGYNNRVWTNNVMVLGNNVSVRGNTPEKRENAVVLGNNSDGGPTVKKVNSANVNGMVYSGFKGNLGATKTDGSEAEKADNELQGRFVSIGAATTDKDGATVYGERQIKHVAAGEISSTSTDAINGSQLYAVASGLRDAFPVVYTDADGNKVVKYPDGKYYPEGTTFDADGNPSNPPVTNVIASMNNGDNKTNEPMQLANVGSNLPTVNDTTKQAFDPNSTEPKAGKDNKSAPITAKEAADIANKAGNNAATVSDVLNAGWNLQNNGEARDFVKPYDTVNFVNGKGTTAVVETADNLTSTVKFDVDAGEITADETKPGAVKGPNTTGKTPTELAKNLADAQKAVDDLAKDPSATKDAKQKAQDALKAAQDESALLNKVATAQNVADMINASGFTLKADKTEGDNLTAADLANGETINPGDTITMKAGKNMSVKHEKDGSITYATKDDVSFNTVNVGDNTYVDENGKPVTKDGDKYKDAEGNPVDAAKVTKLSPVAMKAEKAKPATNNGNKAEDQPTTALNVSSSDGKPTQITGVGSTLNVKPVDTNPNGKATTGDARPNLVDLVGTKDAPVNKNAAATVGDLQNMGWVVSSDKATDATGEYKDVVKNANEVRFVGKNAAKVSGKTDPTTGIRTITVDVEAPSVETAKITQNTNGSVTGPADETLTKALKDAKDALAKLPKDADAATVKAAQDKVDAAQKAIDNSPNSNKVATAQNVADMINASGFTLKTSATADGKKESGDDEIINPGKTVEMIAGKNLTVKQEANGKVTYATKDDVSFNTVNVGDNTYVDENGKPVTKDGDKYKDAEGNPVDAAKVTKLSPVAMKAEKAKPATNNGNKAEDQPTTALNVSSSDGKPTQITGVGSTLNVKPVDTNTNGTPTADADKPNLVDLVGPKDAPVNKNAAATVGDLQNMGWVVSTKDSNGYKDVVKNANQVDFKGTGLATVTGETKDGIRTITVNVDAQKAVEAIQTPVVYTNKDGNKLVKVGDKFYKAGDVVNGKPQENAKAVPNGDVIASMNNGDNNTSKPMQLANVGSNLPTVNDTTKQAFDPNSTEPKAGKDNKSAPITAKEAADIANKAGNNAATVSDVLNAGWNLQNNGEARDFVKPYDTVNFVNGKGTTAVVETADNLTSTVKFDVDAGEITADTTKPGAVKGPVTADEAKKLADNLKKVEQAVKDLPADATEDKKAEAQKALKAAQDAVAPLNKVATAQNVAEAINNSGWRTNSTTATGAKKDTLINPGKAVNFESGKNMEVTQTVDKDGNVAYTYATKADVQFNSVQLGGDNGPKLTNDGKDLKVSGSNGTDPVKITNVADGNISADSKDAVNGSQLHATNQSINRLGDTVNNIGGNVTRLSDKVDNMDRDYRAGIAGSNAAASLPQVYLPGKSMVAAAAGTFKGQNALAVGYSSISDNGKLIWKAQANLNSRADVGVGVGMGYLW